MNGQELKKRIQEKKTHWTGIAQKSIGIAPKWLSPIHICTVFTGTEHPQDPKMHTNSSSLKKEEEKKS